MTDSQNNELRQRIIASLRKVKDPEIPINLYDLGLIYGLEARDDGTVLVRMTLTTPNCPVAESMPGQVRQAVESVDGVASADVELVWEPPWTGEMMTDDARDTLEMMGISWKDPHSSARNTSLTIGRSGKPDRSD